MVLPFTIHDSHSHPPRLWENGRRKTEDAELAAAFTIHDSHSHPPRLWENGRRKTEDADLAAPHSRFTIHIHIPHRRRQVVGTWSAGRWLVHGSRFTFTSPDFGKKDEGRQKLESSWRHSQFKVRRSRTCQPGSREEGARPEAFRLSVHDSSRASRSRGRPVTPDEHGLPGREDLAVRRVVGPVQTVAPPDRGLVWFGSVRPLFGDHSPGPDP